MTSDRTATAEEIKARLAALSAGLVSVGKAAEAWAREADEVGAVIPEAPAPDGPRIHNPFVLPGGNRSGNPWNIGTSFFPAKGLVRYEKDVGKIDIFAGSSTHSKTAWDTWDRVVGGPVSDDHAKYATLAHHEPRVQTNWMDGTTFGAALAHPTDGQDAWYAWIMHSVPKTYKFEGNPKADGWRRLGNGEDGADERWFALGYRCGYRFVKQWKKKPELFAVRKDWELNNGTVSQVYADQVEDYNRAAKRFCVNFRLGFDAGCAAAGSPMPAGRRVPIILALARQDVIAPIEDLLIRDEDGGHLYDAVELSMHPALHVNFALRQPRDFDAECRAVREWMQGKHHPGYAWDHSDPLRSLRATCRKHRIAAICCEWNPKTADVPAEKERQCKVSKAVYTVAHEMFAETAAEGLMAGECLFNPDSLLESDAITANWAEGAREFKRLWKR